MTCEDTCIFTFMYSLAILIDQTRSRVRHLYGALQTRTSNKIAVIKHQLGKLCRVGRILLFAQRRINVAFTLKRLDRVKARGRIRPNDDPFDLK